MWRFPKIGVPKMDSFIMENAIKIDDLGVHLFQEPPIFSPWNMLLLRFVSYFWTGPHPIVRMRFLQLWKAANVRCLKRVVLKGFVYNEKTQDLMLKVCLFMFGHANSTAGAVFAWFVQSSCCCVAAAWMWGGPDILCCVLSHVFSKSQRTCCAKEWRNVFDTGPT
jgi:hypothetical protein